MIKGAWIKKDGELILTMVEDILTRSIADADMCPIITLELYTTAEQSGILEDTVNRKMMLYILQKILNGWHTIPSK